MPIWLVVVACLGVLVALVALYDVTQRRHAILRNFPILGHFRYLLESIGPELRQYIVTNNDEERPFSRDQRSWVYASAKKQNNYAGFGTDNDLENSTTIVIKQATFPAREPLPGDPDYDALHPLPCAKVIGARHARAKAFRPASAIYVSGMSYGSLSAPAVTAINRGCNIAGALHNTGEGSISAHHDQGGDLVWQIGTGYFGCRTPDGAFCLDRLVERAAKYPVRAIELKLSQGAKPGRGGVLPAEKITPEIAEIRGIPMGKDCISPAYHTAFSDVDSMITLIEQIAARTGLPVGIKSAVGALDFWETLARRMRERGEGPDYIAIDGGEGGTGAAPLVFSDHVSLPFKIGFRRVRRVFEAEGIADEVVWWGAGRLGFPQETALAFGLGCDMVGVAREAMLAIGCIQALRCHTGHCPTGVATQNRWLVRGLDPTYKAARLANYLIVLRKETMWLARACGVDHPSAMGIGAFEVVEPGFRTRPAADVFG